MITYKNLLNTFEDKWFYIKSEYILLNRNVYKFSDFFGFTYGINGYDAQNNLHTDEYTEYGYTQTLEFYRRKIMYRPPEENYPKIFNGINVYDFKESEIKNYPYYLVINSNRNMQYIIKNWYKKDGGFKNVLLYEFFYKFLGFIQVNNEENDFNIFYIYEKNIFLFDKKRNMNILILEIMNNEYIDLEKKVIVFLEYY